MDRVLQPSTAKINCGICTRCRSTIDARSIYKTCQLCREKDRVRREKSQIKKDMQHLGQFRSYHEDDATSASMKERQENAAPHDGNRKFITSVKRKAQKSLYELEAEERMVALKMAKKSLTEIVQRQGKKPMPAVQVNSINNGHEYLNASSLYDDLKLKALSSYPAHKYGTQFLQFHGSHTIVAVPSIDNFKRVKLVITDLRKIARLSFEHDATPLQGPPGSLTFCYTCSCIGHTQTASQPHVDKLNGAGSLLQWARARSKVASTSTQAEPRLCGGKIYIIVADDNTHTLDILGQQIIVRVVHPNV